MTRAQIRRRIEKIMAGFNRLGLKNRNFSIISNNCWGGTVYDKYGLQYLTPTIGMWIPPEDYLRFLGNLRFYLSSELKQIKYTESHAKDLLIEKKKNGKIDGELDDVIIGRLVDVDIIFIHNKDFADAAAKWQKRAQRVNLDNLLVKMNDQNSCTEENCSDFLGLPYENKILFTANEKLRGKNNVLYFEKYKADGYVVNDTKIGSVPLNTTKLLNSMKKSK